MKKSTLKAMVKPENSPKSVVLSGVDLITALKNDRDQFEKDFYSRKAKNSTSKTSEKRLGNLRLYEDHSEDLAKWCENHNLPSSFLASVIAWQTADLDFQDTNWNIYIDETWNPRDKFLSHVADERFKYEVLINLWMVRADFIKWRVLNYKIQFEREFLAGINWDWEIRGKEISYEARLNEKLTVKSLIEWLSKTFPKEIAEIKAITEQLEDLRMELTVAELDNIQPKLELIEKKQYLLAQIKERLKNKQYVGEPIDKELALDLDFQIAQIKKLSKNIRQKPEFKEKLKDLIGQKLANRQDISSDLEDKKKTLEEMASDLRKQIKLLQTSVLNTKERVVKKLKNKQKSLLKLYNSEISSIKQGIISYEEGKMALELGL